MLIPNIINAVIPDPLQPHVSYLQGNQKHEKNRKERKKNDTKNYQGPILLLLH